MNKLPEFFGLDIGNHTIKVAQVKYKSAKNIELLALGNYISNTGNTDLNNTGVQNEIADNIRHAKESAGITATKVVAALPESSIFTRLIMLPDVPDKELEQAVYNEASQYLPIPVSEVQLDFIPINKVNVEGRKLVRTLLVAAPKKLTNSFMSIMSIAGLELIALETETIASARAITFGQSFNDSVLVIDFGASGTDISVLKGNNLIFSQSIGTGSDSLTKAISNDFGLDLIQSEQYKRTYGLNQDQADGKILKSLTPVMDVIINEINKTINYFRAHLQESSPTKVILVGDGANLPGLSAYITTHLGITSQRVNPISKLKVSLTLQGRLAQMSTAGFAVSIGLAMKNN